MFLGFLSKRTFSGFCSSYMRYCVRSYIRNCMVRDARVAAYLAARSEGGSSSAGAAGRTAPRRGGWERTNGVTAHWVRQNTRGRPAGVARSGGLRGGATRGRRA